MLLPLDPGTGFPASWPNDGPVVFAPAPGARRPWCDTLLRGLIKASPFAYKELAYYRAWIDAGALEDFVCDGDLGLVVFLDQQPGEVTCPPIYQPAELPARGGFLWMAHRERVSAADEGRERLHFALSFGGRPPELERPAVG